MKGRLARKPSTTWSDARLVGACLKGDEAAWSALIDKYKNLIYSVPLRYHASPEDAADVFQAVCLDLFGDLARLRDVESLRSWLITVAAHKALRLKEQVKRRGETGDIDLEDGRISAAVGTIPPFARELEREQTLREAMSQVSPRCRELVRLLFYEDPPLPYAEVARRLGLATGSIGFIRARCLKRLRGALERMGF